MALVCGIDEAGRGPIIGPMVMAGALIEEEKADSLKKLGVRDSKLLSQKKREYLFGKIIRLCRGHKIVVIEPAEIDAALRSDTLNLNWLEAHKSAEILNALKPERAIIDSPHNNVDKYRQYLLRLLDNKKTELVVEHKADVNHVVCGAASILAKVTRESEVAAIKKRIGIDFGSGYLTDPLTKSFLEKHYRDFPGIFRETWMPYRELDAGKLQRTLGDFNK